MDQLNLLTTTLFCLRSVVTGIQKAVLVLMYFAGVGAVSVGLGLVEIGNQYGLDAGLKG